MNREHAIYFLEGLIAGMGAPTLPVAKGLFMLLSFNFGVTGSDLNEIRGEIDRYIQLAEVTDDRPQ